MTLVSIIIPTFNRAAMLKRAVTSCLSQTHTEIEVIIVDDCSTDETAKTLQAIKDPRVKHFKNQKNLGGPKSRNKGLKHAKGTYINFLDDDDELKSEKIELQLKKFQTSKVENLGIVTCDVRYSRKDISEVKRNRARGNIYRQLLKHYYVHATHSMLIKKEVLKNIFFDESLPSNQEYDLMITISKKWNFDYVPRVLARVNQSTNQISFNFPKKIEGTKRLYKKHSEKFKKEKVYMYNFLRFSYLLFKYHTSKWFGMRWFLWLP